MNLIASFFSGLKAEVQWLIASLAVASGNSDGASAADTQTADATGHHNDSAPETRTEIQTLAAQLPNSTEHSSAQHANTDDGQGLGSNTHLSDVADHSPTNLLLNADFLIDTTDHFGPAPSPGLTPISFEQSTSDLSGISTLVTASPPPVDQDYHVTLPENDSHGISQPHSAAGDFLLASLTPQMLGDFAKGGGHGPPGGGGGGGGGVMTTQYVSHQGTSFTLTLNFDSSVANAPTDASLVNSNNTSGSVFIADMEKVADFFTSHYTNAVSAPVTINVGYGEIAGSGLGGGALGESESFYTQVAYSTLQSKFQSASLPGSDIGSGSHQYWVTTAEAKGLGITVLNGTNPDGYVGFSGAANTFDFTPGTAHGSGKYDFIGVAAHEISEVLGRATLNGAKDFGGGYADYSTLDLFHWSDNSSPPSHTFSASAAGYFSLDGSTSANEGYKEFNTNSLGDASDWQQISGSSDAYDWAGGLSMNSPVSYADYLVMEAAGWMGNLPGSTPTTWSWDGV